MDSQKISTGSSESDCTTVPALSVDAPAVDPTDAAITAPAGYTYLARNGHGCWKHEGGLHWITRYDAIPETSQMAGRPEVFYAYRCAAKLPKGREPWTVDNRTLERKGFRTIEAAAAAIAIARSAS